jgi:hypothetical protein
MIPTPSQVWLVVEPIDMRAGIDGLSQRIKNTLAHVCRLPQRLLNYHADKTNKSREWHYIRVLVGSGDEFLNTSGLMSEAESVVQPQEIGFGARGLAHMQGTPVLLHEAGGDTTLYREYLAQTGPGVVNAMRPQALANRLDKLIRQHRDEQMAIGAFLLRMEDRTQTQFALQV